MKPTKIIRINKCLECPHVLITDTYEFYVVPVCELKERLTWAEEIPEWCPLEDEPE